MDRYTKVGRGRVHGVLCYVAIDNAFAMWKNKEVTVFSFLVRNKLRHFCLKLQEGTGMYQSVASDCLDALLEQGVIDQDAYRAAIAAHVERML